MQAIRKSGHVIDTLTLKIQEGETGIQLTLRAEDLAFSQVKVIASYEQTSSLDKEAHLSEQDSMREDAFLRINALKLLEKVVDTLFSAFLEIRINDQQNSKDLENMRHFVSTALVA